MEESLQRDPSFSGVNAFAVWTNRATGQAFTGSGFAARTSANLVAGATTGTFDATGYVRFAVPAAVAAVVYDLAIYRQAGGSPATGDLANRPIGTGGSDVAAGDGVSGGDLCTLTLSDGSPIAGMNVWVSSDAAGDHVVAGVLVSNASGQVTVLLIDGVTYYLWATKPGENSIEGRSFVAVKD